MNNKTRLTSFFIRSSIPLVMAVLLQVPLVCFAGGWQDRTQQPLLSPVDIAISAPDNLQTGQEIPITIKVTPQTDMHADISCLLPKGVMPIHGKGMHIMPYPQRGMFSNIERQKQYRLSVGLCRGLLKAGETKELIFKVKISQKGSYNLLCVVNSRVNRGEKNAALIINVH